MSRERFRIVDNVMVLCEYTNRGLSHLYDSEQHMAYMKNENKKQFNKWALEKKYTKGTIYDYR